ncbi:MAG TPA: dTMP kinase [Candidatus Ligilactobacillus excrementigallinarum]|uniref:Thymidylate kinase n=1 Tax=Candidatus Ligilactobacillus excrementigallinarum TaxID=2838641 RepID=A0A9D1UW37_9LACO|nr:dTMP kinase [Candidatus Ligilactobacillus excrementigallinarum]
MSGKFITFEGLDGSGKTTIIWKVIEFLNQTVMKDQFIYTREPGGNRISEAIREIILSKQNTAMDARTEALLYAAARRQHLVETVLPALDAGQLVLSDRYVDSSLVYQGAGREIGMQKIAAINEFATDGLTPDLTIYFEVEPQVGLARIQQNRQDEVNRLDEEQIDFYERVHSGYLKLAQENPNRIKVVDASRSIEEVKAEVLAIIKEFLGLKG